MEKNGLSGTKCQMLNNKAKQKLTFADSDQITFTQ